MRQETDENQNDPKNVDVFSVPIVPTSQCHPSKTYIITGGLGGFGLELADWLVERGARQLVLTSRSGVRQGYQARKKRLWQNKGVRVEVMSNNIKSDAECKLLIENATKMAPVGGIFNLAMVRSFRI